MQASKHYLLPGDSMYYENPTCPHCRLGGGEALDPPFVSYPSIPTINAVRGAHRYDAVHKTPDLVLPLI